MGLKYKNGWVFLSMGFGGGKLNKLDNGGWSHLTVNFFTNPSSVKKRLPLEMAILLIRCTNWKNNLQT